MKNNLQTPKTRIQLVRNDSIFLNNSRKPPGKKLNLDTVHLGLPTLNLDSNNLSEQKLGKGSALTNQSTVKKIKTLVPKGTLSLGYDYGFLPYTLNTASPAWALRSEGRIETDVCNIPLDITYFYSSQKNLIGLTNYFRISFNADRYRDKLNNRLNGNLDDYKRKLSNLNTEKQQALQKMAYADYLSSIHPDKWPLDEKLTNSNSSITGLDTNGLGLSIPTLDTTQARNAIRDSLKVNPYYSKADSLQKQALLYKHKKDSIAGVYETYKNKYDRLNDTIASVQKKINDLEDLTTRSGFSSEKTPYLTNIQNFLSGVKKFDLGLCYPAYSTFLTNNIPVKGINFEYQKNKVFFAFTYGTTVSTLLYNSRNVTGMLQNIRNSYNYFDANNLSSGRKILSVKFGSGEKEKDHFFVGFLLGKGAGTYFLESSADHTSRLIESNLVLEADMRKKISKKTNLDIVLGKSSIQQSDLDIGTIKTAAKEIFSNFQSYAALIKLNTAISTTKSNLTFSLRVVDPFFNSYGIGFMRSDNLRYEIKLDQTITKSLRYVGVFRHEEDNLLKLLNYKNTFVSLNNTLTYKVKRGLVLRAGYTPLVRNLNGENYHFQSKNAILTGIVTWSPRSKTTQSQFNFLYNNYQVSTDSMPINFQNFAYYHQLTFKNGFKTGLNISWFKNNLKDTVGNNVYLFVLDAGYQFKNGSMFSVAGKSAYKRNGQLYPGFIVKSAIKISKTLFWENQIEKYIVGDLFNGYDLNNLKRFPYCFTTKLILNF